jgi:hypothetical protein
MVIVLLCLRQQGRNVSFCVRFSVLRTKNRTQRKIEYRSAVCGELVEPTAKNADCVKPYS